MEKGFSCPSPGIFAPLASVPDVVATIQPGFYEMSSNQSWGLFFQRISIDDKKKLFTFQDNISDVIMKDMGKFWSLKDKYARYKMPFKRGILMHGPPGCGKSSIISLLIRSLLKDGGLIVKFPRNTGLFKGCMRGLRNIQPDLPVIVLMEDLNYVLDGCDESEILNLLDGIENFSHNTVYLATTNYFSDLPNNIKNRPSRFDLVVEVGPPAANIRKQYFESLLLDGDKIEDLDKWVEGSEGLSFAHLEELFKSVFLFDNSFDATLARIRSMGTMAAESDDD